ncbi:MAG TPA: hypothetical protein VFA18_16850 [Gemmataceae bacterium]|nr:hypothetical protein [Gemmataceae bacterium]
MNRIEQPPGNVGGVGHDADDVDVLLRQYFQSEMPRSWPALPPPTLPFRAVRQKSHPWRSRLTLAASVACLLFGSAWFAARAPEPTPNTAPATQEATRRHSLQSEPQFLPDSRRHH